MQTSTRFAFTLLELVVVVLIMGIIYSMVSVSLTKATKTAPILEAKNLATFLQSQTDVAQRTFYLYGDKCEKVIFDPPLQEGIEVDGIKFSQETKAYWFDNYSTLQEKKFAPLKEDHFTKPVCLKFQKFANGSTSPMVIESGGFYFHPFFEKVMSFASLEEAREGLKKSKINPDNLRVYR